MTSSDFFSLLSAVSLFAIACTLVPIFCQLRRTLQKIEAFIEVLNNQVNPLCHSLTEAANEIQLLTSSLNTQLEKTDAIIHNAQRSVTILLNTAIMLKETALPFITKIGGISAGIMTFSHFLNRSWKTQK